MISLCVKLWTKHGKHQIEGFWKINDKNHGSYYIRKISFKYM